MARSCAHPLPVTPRRWLARSSLATAGAETGKVGRQRRWFCGGFRVHLSQALLSGRVDLPSPRPSPATRTTAQARTVSFGRLERPRQGPCLRQGDGGEADERLSNEKAMCVRVLQEGEADPILARRRYRLTISTPPVVWGVRWVRLGGAVTPAKASTSRDVYEYVAHKRHHLRPGETYRWNPSRGSGGVVCTAPSRLEVVEPRFSKRLVTETGMHGLKGGHARASPSPQKPMEPGER
jgi:hypothetical protein